MAIQFIYFDVGGVVVKDFSGTNKWEELKTELGINSDKEEQYQEIWPGLEHQFCLNLSEQAVVTALNEQLQLQIPSDYSLLDGFVNRFEPNPSLWPILRDFKRHYRIGLLTNMYVGMLDRIKVRKILPPVEFDVIVDSSVVGYLKPDPKIFKVAEKMAGVPGKSILFIDNSQMHVDAAIQFGWQAMRYDPTDVEKSNKRVRQKIFREVTSL